MKKCLMCKNQNTTMSGLCIACQVAVATKRALDSHICQQKLKNPKVVEIFPGVRA